MNSSFEALNVWLLESNSNGVICGGVPIDKFKYFPLVTILLTILVFFSWNLSCCLNNDYTFILNINKNMLIILLN